MTWRILNRSLNIGPKTTVAVIHAVFWGVYLFFVFTLFMSNSVNSLEVKYHHRLPVFLLRIVFDISVFYTLYGYGIPKLLGKGRVRLFLIMAVGFLVFYTASRHLFEAWWYDNNTDFTPLAPREVPLWGQLMVRGLSGLFVTVMAGVGRFTFDWFRAQKEKQELETKRLTSELAYLKSQVNPHFLFNTLNNIYGLARKKSPVTEDAILKLSGMMRYMLYETNVPQVPLDREVQQLQDYIALQGLRYARQDVVTFHTEGNLPQFAMPPLLLVPLVENGFKHGRFSQPDDQLELSLVANEDSLTFQVENIIAPATEERDAAGGVGLENIKRRLALLYPNAHRLDFQTENNRFCATLEIQWK